MNKSKVSYRLSKSEFWMLIILVAVALVALSVIYLITPAMDVLALTEQELDMANARLASLRQDNARIEEYRAQDAEAELKLAALRERLPGFYSQEITISTLDTLSAKNALEIVSVAFGGVKLDTREALVATLAQDGRDVARADISAADLSELVRYETINIGFSGSYDAIYGFVGDLAKETRAVFTRELVLMRAKGGAVSGTITLLMISGVEAGDYPGYLYGAPAATGKADPFAAFPGYLEGEAAEASALTALTPDFYVILNSYDDNAEKLYIGKYGDAASQLAFKDNKQMEGTITFEEADGKIAYTYELGGKKESGSITPSLEHPDELVVSVLSRARKNASDKVGITLSVVNKTGLLVILDIKNDDAASPRFKLGATQGMVQTGR